MSTAAPADRRAERCAKLKLLAAVMVPAWGRAVLAIVGATVVTNLVGLGDVSNYAVIPGVYMALSGAVGSVYRRVGAVAAATIVIAALSFVGAELSRWTVAVVIGLAVVGFVMGLLPRAGRARSVRLALELVECRGDERRSAWRSAQVRRDASVRSPWPRRWPACTCTASSGRSPWPPTRCRRW